MLEGSKKGVQESLGGDVVVLLGDSDIRLMTAVIEGRIMTSG